MESKAEKKFDLSHDSYWWDDTYTNDTHATYEEFEEAASTKAKNYSCEVVSINLGYGDQWQDTDCGRENRYSKTPRVGGPWRTFRHCRRCGKHADLSLVTPLKRKVERRDPKWEKIMRLYLCMECSHSGLGFMAIDFAKKCMLNNNKE